MCGQLKAVRTRGKRHQKMSDFQATIEGNSAKQLGSVPPVRPMVAVLFEELTELLALH